jgi:NAD(P)-dependent dehydrogenase (short-subunit alcohol dehydrogenase family)
VAGGALIVTGASRGIGAATARLAAKRGYAVGVNYLSDAHSADAVVRDIVSAGGKAIAIQADVGDETAVAALFARVDRELGPLAGLVNNAGINGGVGAFAEMDGKMLRQVIETDLLGAMHCIRQAIPRMSRLKGGAGGAIVNVSSQAAIFGGSRITAYAAAKAGLNALTVGLARELAPEGIRVNAVSPGVIETDLHHAVAPERRERTAATLPLGRPGRPDEVAETILWLIESAPEYLSGAIVPVSGAR